MAQTLPKLTPDKVAFHLPGGCWRHLRSPVSPEQSSSSLCRHRGQREDFQSPVLQAHVVGLCLRLYFPKDSLSVSLPCVYTPLCVQALRYQGALLKALTALGKAL